MSSMNKIYKLLSSKLRLAIVMHLYSCSISDCNVDDLVQQFKVKQANLSKNLKILLDSNVIEFTKNKRFIYYKLTNSFLEEFREILDFTARRNEIKSYFCKCKKSQKEAT